MPEHHVLPFQHRLRIPVEAYKGEKFDKTRIPDGVIIARPVNNGFNALWNKESFVKSFMHSFNGFFLCYLEGNNASRAFLFRDSAENNGGASTIDALC